jgi:hypothetical protein
MVLACLFTAARANVADAVGGAEPAVRGCSIVGKWRSFDNSEHINLNMTMIFVADGTYLSNVESKSFPCHCILAETGVWSQSPAQTDLVLTSKACHCTLPPLSLSLFIVRKVGVCLFVRIDHRGSF